MKQMRPPIGSVGLLVALVVLIAVAPLLEADPLQAAADAIRVTSAADSGPGTLRQALLDVTAGETISFSATAFPPGSPVTIVVESPLPALDDNDVTIDASDAGVVLDGSRAPANTDGLSLHGDGCGVRGLTIQNFPRDGIVIESGASGNGIGGDRSIGVGPNGQGNLIVQNGSSGISVRGDRNVVRGNFVGVDSSGRWALGNTLNGVALWDGASDNVVGGPANEDRNVIGGNGHNGVWISGSGTARNDVLGNEIGTRADGLGPLPNGYSGVAIQNGAKENRIGGTAGASGNLISGNGGSGVHISGVGTTANRVFGNIIGANRSGTGIIGQGLHGVHIAGGASDNRVGDGTAQGRNLISGNAVDGVCISGAETVSNTVQGNYVGTNLDGTAALPNRLHGAELTDGAHDNLIGGDSASQGNLLSGNLNHGLVISEGAHHNTVRGNFIGPDVTGTYSLGNQPWGGIDVAEGAHHNQIGGPGPGQGNLISGNQTDGIALFHTTVGTTPHNSVVGNRIGLTSSGAGPLSNGEHGILNGAGATYTQIQSNTIAYHDYGVTVGTCTGNTISGNAIYSHTLQGIKIDGSGCPSPPQLTGVSIGSTEVVTGAVEPGARVELYSDDEDEGRIFEGQVVAGGEGDFSYAKLGGFAGPNLTAIAIDGDGNTSRFSEPVRLSWTYLLYLNGDNDLEPYMLDTLSNVVSAGQSPRANVLALIDGYTATTEHAGTVLYDLTGGEATKLDVDWNSAGEQNMGDGQTLVDFVTWGRARYPARHTLLSIVDHGGGWAPGDEVFPSGGGALAHRRRWSAGSSGLSWDFTDGHDYLTSTEIRQAFATITGDGSTPLDVVFYDACLTGMLEIGYQIKDYASFFVSSQNIGWAPFGSHGRYVRTIQGLQPTTTPRQMAELLVEGYAISMPPQLHPYTISATDLSSLSAVVGAADQLASAISDTLEGPDATSLLHQVYRETQKLDYDSDFAIEPDRDGFVDLHDFARQVSETYKEPDVTTAAASLMTAVDAAVVAEAHRSGTPWMAMDREWDLDGVRGLSVFLPLGEDLELPITITETSEITPDLVSTRNLRLRDAYTGDQLLFVKDTAWGDLIRTYYDVVASPVPTGTTDGPVDAPQKPDVAAPRTTITATGTFAVGEVVTFTWAATDTETGVERASLWHRGSCSPETAVLTQTDVSSGTFVFPLSRDEACLSTFSVRAIDGAGNRELFDSGFNSVTRFVDPCIFLPLVMRGN
jgi:titin